LSLVSLSSQVLCLRVRPEPIRVKHLSGAPLYGRPLASPINIRLGWTGLPGTNTLAYYENPKITSVKSFIVPAPGYFFQSYIPFLSTKVGQRTKGQYNTLFTVVIYRCNSKSYYSRPFCYNLRL
jgi:hypothetical protein